MPKVTKKTATKKKNPLLETEEEIKSDTSEEKVDAESESDTDTAEVEDEGSEEEVEEKPKAKAKDTPTTGARSRDVSKEALGDIEATRIALSKEPQVNFMIPLMDGEKIAHHDVWINGYKVTIPKGRMAIIPQSIANILMNTYKVQAEAGAEFRLDLNPDKQDKVS